MCFQFAAAAIYIWSYGAGVADVLIGAIQYFIQRLLVHQVHAGEYAGSSTYAWLVEKKKPDLAHASMSFVLPSSCLKNHL